MQPDSFSIMKTSVRYLSTLLCLAAIGSLAFAADDEVTKEKRVIIHQGEGGPTGPVTFLGVETAPASRTLTEQLGLAPDTGLVVNTVAPDSPAAAVLKPHDILVKLDDQKLIETRQLAVLVRGHKEGDEVTLTYIRGGKEMTAKVKLAKHEFPPVSSLPMPGSWRSGGPDFQPWQAFGPGADGMRRLDEVPGMPRDEMNRILPLINQGHELHAQIIRPGPDDGENTEVTTVNTSNSNMVFTDDAGTLEVKIKDGKKEVLAKNAKGDVIFSGPFNTESERKAAPPEVRDRVDKLERMDGFRFKADADFHPGEFDVMVPTTHRIQFKPVPALPKTPRPLAPMMF
jgi:serine protease Do